MPVEHPHGKPRVGTYVDYYNPRFMQRIGYTEGYGNRFDGPYAALVTNNLGDGLTLTIFLPSATPSELTAVPFKTEAPDYIPRDGTNHPAQNGKGYWDWQNPAQAARAAKSA